MILQGLLFAGWLVLTTLMMLFIMSPTMGLKAAYADSWRKTGKGITHLFQIQSGPERWIGVVAFGTIGLYLATGVALEIAARFAH